MPELPEVETTRRGITPHIVGRRIVSLAVHEPRLRWRVPDSLPGKVAGQKIRVAGRRAKYLLIELEAGTLLLHLGMSGSLREVLERTGADALMIGRAAQGRPWIFREMAFPENRRALAATLTLADRCLAARAPR